MAKPTCRSAERQTSGASAANCPRRMDARHAMRSTTERDAAAAADATAASPAQAPQRPGAVLGRTRACPTPAQAARAPSPASVARQTVAGRSGRLPLGRRSLGEGVEQSGACGTPGEVATGNAATGAFRPRQNQNRTGLAADTITPPELCAHRRLFSPDETSQNPYLGDATEARPDGYESVLRRFPQSTQGN